MTAALGFAATLTSTFVLAAALTLPLTPAIAHAAEAATPATPGSGNAPAMPAAEVHGASDAIALPGAALAWGVLRGRDESSTRVAIRIDADPSRFATVEIVGVDPFGGGRKVHLRATPIGGTFEFRAPRAEFADYPRTELRFATGATGAVRAGDVTVYYQGVPDTTPEFEDAARLDAYLDARIAKAKAAAVAKP